MLSYILTLAKLSALKNIVSHNLVYPLQKSVEYNLETNRSLKTYCINLSAYIGMVYKQFFTTQNC